MSESRAIPGAGDVIALLGAGSHFEGKLTFEGTVRIDGEFTGEIFSQDTLVIGPGARVRAELELGTLMLQGHLVGNVSATDVVDLRAPGRLEGNIVAPNVTIEKGAFFDGKCSMAPPSRRASGGGAEAPGATAAAVPAQTVAPSTNQGE